MQVISLFIFFFFFSSRRRHTRLTCDWSSDVCSSDLVPSQPPGRGHLPLRSENDGFLLEAGHDATGEIGADMAPERIADQVVGIPRTAQLGVGSEPAKVRLAIAALKLPVNQRREFFLHGSPPSVLARLKQRPQPLGDRLARAEYPRPD